MRPKGFSIPGGYMGLLPNGRYQLFETEGEYLDYIKEETDNGEKLRKSNSDDNESVGTNVQE